MRLTPAPALVAASEPARSRRRPRPQRLRHGPNDAAHDASDREEDVVKAIRIHANGGPDVMRWEDIELPPPGAGEARVRHTAIGVNYSDINVRQGGFYLAQPLQFPLILGNEAVGVVDTVGPGVTHVHPGDHVGYVGMSGEFFQSTGAYAEQRNVPAERLIRLTPGLSDQQAAACLLKGLTASLILNWKYRPNPGDTVLVHAAASGVGLILCQWAKHLGA